MTEESEDGHVIDPDLREELEDLPAEDPFVTEYGTSMGSGSAKEESINFADKWFPDWDQWQGKTRITPRQARALAAVRALPLMWEELEDLEPFLDQFVRDYEMYLTSIDGVAREQHADILRSMFGGEAEQEERRRDMIMGAIAGVAQDDE